MMKKGLFTAMLLTLALLTGCQKEATVATSETTGESTEETEAEVEAEDENDGEAEVTAARIRHYYAGLLSQLLYTNSLPDMDVQPLYNDSLETMRENTFAITDIDGDGREELIISYTTTSMAGMFEVIYEYDPDADQLNTELLTFPSLTYYDNGIIKADVSHNQTFGMDFWPFSLYQYQEDTDSYVLVGYVETWEKGMETGATDEVFPDELDTDGDGVLYKIVDGPNTDWSASDFQYNEADYEEWYASYMDGANEIQMDAQPLDFENFISYTTDYLNLLKDNKVKEASDESTDLAVMFLDEGTSLDELETLLSEEYDITIEEMYDDDDVVQIGTVQGEEVFLFEQLDEGFFSYSGQAVENITFFGVYPGMDEEEALANLADYGFYMYDEESGHLITGEGIGNQGVYYEAEDGKIKSITVSQFCAFAG